MSSIFSKPGMFLLLAQIGSIIPGPTPEACGKFVPRQGKILGGNESFPGEFSFMVSIKSITTGHFCGGFVVNNRHIISAAHCFFKAHNFNMEYNARGKPLLNHIVVSVGEFSLKSAEDPNAVNATVENIKIHPNYDDDTLDNDIAILRLDKNIDLHTELQPICLPASEPPDGYANQKVAVAGWGKTSCFQGDFAWKKDADKMQKVDIAVLTNPECIQMYKDYNFKKKDFMCAGEPGKDSSKVCSHLTGCNNRGDSGGPLMLLSQNRWMAIGIVSAGPRCGEELPGVYTRVSTHLDWIHSITS